LEIEVSKIYVIISKVRGHVTEDIQVVKSMIGEDSSDVTGFAMTSDKTKCLNPKVIGILG
jgi:hypothetical protein